MLQTSPSLSFLQFEGACNPEEFGLIPLPPYLQFEIQIAAIAMERRYYLLLSPLKKWNRRCRRRYFLIIVAVVVVVIIVLLTSPVASYVHASFRP